MFGITLPGGYLISGIIAIIIGVIILIFPRIINYLIGIGLILGGIASIVGGAWIPGIISLIFGIIIMIFPRILN